MSSNRYTFHSFAYPNEINRVRARLKDANVNYKTVATFRNKTLIGYRIYVS